MNKEDILAKSREENKEHDERQKQELKNIGYISGLGGIAFALVFGLVALIQMESVYPFIAIVFAQLSINGFLSHFKIDKNKSYMVQGIAFGLAAAIYTFMYFRGL